MHSLGLSIFSCELVSQLLAQAASNEMHHVDTDTFQAEEFHHGVQLVH